MTPTAAVARLSFAATLRQPLTWLVLAVSVALMGGSYLFGMFTFDSDDRLRVLSTAGVAIGAIHGCVLAVASAAISVHEDIASRTIHTLLAKPMPRHAYPVGKALGVIAAVAVVALIIAVLHLGFLGLVAWLGFDPGRYAQRPDHGSAVLRVLAGHLLGLGGSAAMACLATALAVRLQAGAAIGLCLAAFVGTHLLGLLGIVGLPLPAMHLGNIDEALSYADTTFSGQYLTLSLLHFGLYSAASLVVASALLSRADLP